MTTLDARRAGYRATKALIKVGGACNEKCVFCHATGFREIDLQPADVLRKVDLARRRGFEMVVLSGGEPTIYPALREIVERVYGHKMLLGFVTNGVRFGYPEFCTALLARNLRYVYLSLHGGDARTHNRAVVAKTFDQTVAAVRNLAGRGVALTVNCVVTRINVDALGGLAELLAFVPDLRIKYSFVQLRGAGLENADALVPLASEAAAAIREVIESHPAMDVTWGGLPHCLMPGLADRYDDLLTNHVTVMSEVDEERFFSVDTRDFTKTETCRPCVDAGRCTGLHTEYLARHGDAELAPRHGPRPNSFDFERDEIHVGAPGVACPVRGRGEPPWGAGRSLYLARGDGRLELYAARTRDFSDVEIDRARAAGQLYVDVSEKAAPDDFAADLRLARPHAGCDGCPDRGPCPGALTTDGEDVFTRDDAIVREHLARLAGRVLDVGCGEARYRRFIAEGVDYVGIDPSPPSGAKGVAAGRIEDGVPAPGPYDHALVLRSYNHLSDPRRALATLCAALRPGGTLFVCDNVPFGLVRTPEQIARARAATGLSFEHARNDGLTDAVAALAGLPLRVVASGDVTPGRSNQWWLRAERA